MNNTLTLNDLKDRYVDGLHYPQHGCFYFMDYDNELGYFIEMNDGTFENDVNYVDLDTLDDDVYQQVQLAMYQMIEGWVLLLLSMFRRPMYQLQLQFHKQGEWENTVFRPVEYAQALKLMNDYEEEWRDVHNYRIVPVG